MKPLHILFITFAITLAGTPGWARPIELGSPMPLLEIKDKGELVPEGDDFTFQPWSSNSQPETVHVIQYFGATLGDRDVFAPFTDLLQQELEPGTVHVTTILNLDAAMWGTKGMVMSELKKNKTAHPEATIVADADALGVDAWALGKQGTGLFILDNQGKLLFSTLGSLQQDELAPTIELIRANIKP